MKRFWAGIRINWLLAGVVAIGGVLRFYHLRDLTTLGGDQGIDYQNVARMIQERNLTLLGPITHVGVYLGPLYYYLLVPFFLAFRFDPIAAPVMFALFGAATVGLVFTLARTMLRSDVFAFLTALLYAVSPIIIESSRSPSQPHLIPFFATLLLISLLRTVRGQATKWDMLAVGISVGSVIQFHFLAYPLLIVAILVLGYSWLAKSLESVKRSIGWLVVPPALLLLPWVLFELRHQFFITKQVMLYLASGEVSLSAGGVLTRILEVLWFSFDRLVAGGSQFVIVGTLALAVFAIVSLVYSPRRRESWMLLLFFILANVAGISLYIAPLSNHYISALYPAVVLLVMSGFQWLRPRLIGVVLASGLIVFNVSRYQMPRSNGYTMPDGLTTSVIERISAIIAADTPTDNFEIANTLDGDTRAQPYRYVLTAVHKKPPLPVEAYPSAQLLYVVGRNNEGEILNHPVWEISSFGPQRIVKRWQMRDNIALYRLER